MTRCHIAPRTEFLVPEGRDCALLTSPLESDGPPPGFWDPGDFFQAQAHLCLQPLREAVKSLHQIKTYELLQTMKNFPNKRGGILRHGLNEWSDFRD